MRKIKKEKQEGLPAPPVQEKITVEGIKEAAQKSFGEELIKTLGDERVTVKSREGWSWGCPSLNYICTGDPFVGIVKGRIYELFGDYGSGKTTLCLHAVAETQCIGGIAAFVDAEHAMDVVYAKALGVDLSTLLFSQPDYGEQAIDIVMTFIRLGVNLIIVDSVAALTPLAEVEGRTDKEHMGTHARLMGKAMRKMPSVASRSKAAIIFTNQTRYKIGAVFGNPITTTGGQALKFAASVRMDCFLSAAADKSIKGASGVLGSEEDVRLGSQMRVKTVKNKFFAPYRQTEIPLYYGKGLDTALDWFRFAEERGYITKGKGCYKIPQQKGKELRIGYDKLNENVPMIQKIIENKQ